MNNPEHCIERRIDRRAGKQPRSLLTTELKENNTLLERHSTVSLLIGVLINSFLLVSALSAQSQPSASLSGQWQIAGQNLSNTWSQPAEHSIGPTNVQNLRTKWVFTTGGDVSATPTVGPWPASLCRVGKGECIHFVVSGSLDISITGTPIEGAGYD
jgi:hypothetical protein